MSAAEKWRKFKPLPADIQARLSRLNHLFAREGVLLAYLFGSLAQDGPAHDVDLALLLPPGQRPYHLHGAISDCLGVERVDLVDLRRASPVLKFEIISNGRCLFAIPEERQLNFERHVLRQYKDTAWLRRHQNALLAERMQQWSSNTTVLPSG